jgi:hypothetical protein
MLAFNALALKPNGGLVDTEHKRQGTPLTRAERRINATSAQKAKQARTLVGRPAEE